MAAVGTQLRTPSASGVSRLAQMQERMRENLKQEKESRMMELVARQEADREERINRVKGSSSNVSLSSSQNSLNFSGAGQGRVRKMLEERRNNPNARGYPSPKGIDKSYPLEPVKKEAGKPPLKKGATTRGVSVDRAPKKTESSSMPRSKSQFALRSNNNKSVSQNNLGVPQKQYRSTSSLADGGSRGTSPGPSSTKSSPGPRVPQLTPRKGPPSSIRSPAPKNPPIASKKTQNLTVNGHQGGNSPTSPTQNKGGFFSKIGLNFNKSNSDSSSSKTPSVPPRSKGLKAPQPSPAPYLRKSPVPQTPRKPQDNLPQCKNCGRSFAEDRIEKHQTICTKSQAKAKKRKVFDPSKMRTRGTEAEKYVLRGDHKKKTKMPKKKDWRKTHNDLIQTLRAAKGVPGVETPKTDYSDYVKCPHCGRKFNEAAADRHIPKCADIKSNKRR